MIIPDDKSLLLTKHVLSVMIHREITWEMLIRSIENVHPTLIGVQKIKLMINGKKLTVVVREGRTRRTIFTIYEPSKKHRRNA